MDIKSVIDLARIELTEDEVKLYSNHMEKIVEYIDQLNQADITGINLDNEQLDEFIREDEVDLKLCLSQEEVLINSPDNVLGEIKIPKVIE